LAPQLEDPWLILAAVASPRGSVSYIQRALQINPNSPRARKGMQWALQRLQEEPPAQRTVGDTQPVKSSARGLSKGAPLSPPAPVRQEQARPARRVAPKKASRTPIFPILLLAVGCVAVIFAAWTASTTPALASILSGVSQPEEELHPQVWARVEIAKPAQTSEPVTALAEVESTPLPPTPTLPAPALEPIEAPPTSTPEPDPSLAPEATSTPTGSLVMNIVEETPVPSPQPADEGAAPTAKPQPPVGNGEHWIEVNLSEQRVYAWEGDVLMNSFLVSTGTWQTPTVTGTFSIWNKTRIQAMSGPGYYLPNVPFVMYFYKDYGFHGTYWHNNFGTPMSHGCVNLTIPDSEWLYNWASYGTVVKVHY
jgi:lipoprotein-anchoring transpeptidase ErfK/SrfK